MKTSKSSAPLLHFALIVAALLVPAFVVSGQGTTFTYQGRLDSGSGPANGFYDLRFSLFGSSAGGSPIGSPLTQTGVVVSNGLVAVPLDFGAGSFPGADRWLELEVRSNGLPAFVLLSPRQKVTAAPYAVTAGNMSGILNAGQLSGSYSNALAFGNPGNVFAGIGSGLINLNPGAIAWAGCPPWSICGNAGTIAGIHFVGTTDNQPLELKVNNQRALRIEPNAANAPNLIGGSSVNFAASGSAGVTISGGRSNRVLSSFGTVGGGATNSVYGQNSLIAGGSFNEIGNDFGANPHSVIGGGLSNRIAESLGDGGATIAGGVGNLIDFQAERSTIGGGHSNSISRSSEATIAGGGHNSMSDQSERATIGGGYANRVNRDGAASTVGGGSENTIGYGARQSTISGGDGNIIGTPVPSGFLLGGVVGGGVSNNIGDAADYSTISGGNQNIISTSAALATISGGNFNKIFGTNSTIGGGYSNTLSALNSTIGGGIQNRIFGVDLPEGAVLNTISGGGSNSISGFSGPTLALGNTIGGGTENGISYRSIHNTIGGGGANSIAPDGGRSTIGGGYQNRMDGVAGTIAGGRGNQIDAYARDAGSIGGGHYNLIQSSDIATIGGGYTNSIGGNANYSTIAGGASNRISSGAVFATIPGGYQAKASSYGQLAYASGQFAAVGDAQTAVYVCRGTSTGAAPVALFLDGSSERMAIPANSTWTYDILVTGRTAGGSSAGYQIRGVIENSAGTTAMVGAPALDILGEDVLAWTVATVADNVNDALTVQVTGAAATTIRWVATVRTVEVTY